MKFPIPKKVDVGPHTLDVVIKPLDENCGEYVFHELEIRIAEGMKETARLETFCHELVEAANHVYELGLPHRTIQILGAAFAQAIRSSR